MFRYSKEPIFEERRAESHSTNRETPVPKTQLSYNEYYKYFNKLQPDGRVNLGPDEDGELFSLSIPPYLDGFLDNIEDRIKPLVSALVAKNYLPISSCKSHSIFDNRFVTLCFNSLDSLNDFDQSIRMIPGVNTQIFKTYCNMPFTRVKGNLKFMLSTPRDIEMERKYLNHFFSRNSSEWYFLEVRIGEVIVMHDVFIKTTLLNDIRRVVRTAIWKLLFLEKRTKELTALISSEKIPIHIG